MNLTIGKKLGLGFGAVIGLFAISAATAYYNVSRMRANVGNVLDEAIPMARSCDKLLSSLNQASSSLRGYLLVASDAKLAEPLRASHDAAWSQVDEELSRLNASVAGDANETLRKQVEALARLIDEQRDVQSQITQLAGTEDNSPARQAFDKDAAPRVQEILTTLDAIVAQEAMQEPSAERMHRLKAVADVRYAYALVAAELGAYVLSGDEVARRGLDEFWKNANVATGIVQQSADKLTREQRAQWDRVIVVRDELATAGDQIVDVRGADDWNRAEHLWATKSAPRARDIGDALQRISDIAEARRSDERRELDAASRMTVAAIVTATAVSVVLGLTIAVLLGRSMVATVRTLAERAKQISDGDLRGNAIAARSADELGQLADGFNVMLVNLRDLTGQILSVSENVNSATAQISSSTKQQVSSTKEQAATVQEITSTMQEISQAGAQIVDKAKEVAAAAEEASSASKAGAEAVQNTNRTMEAIREQVEEVAENIVALSEKTQAVGEIIATVNEIAEQSNLLALNATIEAAEAGQDGARFSVVAAEMKNLADQAKDCTVHVRKILGEIQKAINTSVMLTEEAVKRVESGKQQADVSEEVIRQMSMTTDESIQAFQQIIGATNQQQVGVQQVAQGMRNIDQATQQTATGTAQLEQAVVSLSALSRQLQTAVASYKV